MDSNKTDPLKTDHLLSGVNRNVDVLRLALEHTASVETKARTPNAPHQSLADEPGSNAYRQMCAGLRGHATEPAERYALFRSLFVGAAVTERSPTSNALRVVPSPHEGAAPESGEVDHPDSPRLCAAVIASVAITTWLTGALFWRVWDGASCR